MKLEVVKSCEVSGGNLFKVRFLINIARNLFAQQQISILFHVEEEMNEILAGTTSSRGRKPWGGCMSSRIAVLNKRALNT